MEYKAEAMSAERQSRLRNGLEFARSLRFLGANLR